MYSGGHNMPISVLAVDWEVIVEIGFLSLENMDLGRKTVSPCLGGDFKILKIRE